MDSGLSNFGRYRVSAAQRAEAEKWLGHVGAEGRGSDILRISPDHCAIKLTVAGQYDEGGQNYWENPKEFGAALIEAVVKHWDAVSGTAIAVMRERERHALIAAKAEVAAVQDAITKAEAA